MKKVISKKVLVLLSLLLFLPLFSGCFLTPSVNQTPTITSTPITTATVDELYTYDVDATDPDGDTLTYSLSTNPTGMSINSATGLINWTPTSAQIGDHNVTVEVSDGEKSTTQSFTITVSKTPTIPPSPPTNHAPTITSTPITTVTVDEPYTYDVEATDSDNDILTYSLTTNPAGMTIDSVTGEISWTPISSQIGDNDVSVEVSDGEKYDTQSFRITVTDTVVVTFNPIALTSIIVDPKDMTLFVEEDHTLTSITARYNYGPDKPLTLADCSYSSDNETVATVATGVVTGVGAGSATITVSYTEGTITKTDTVEVMVNPIGLDSITVLPETMSLFVGEDHTIASITARYNYGPDKPLTLADCSYSSNNEVIATVDTGVVTGVSDGSATITISYEENGITKTDIVAVTVNPLVLTSIAVLPNTMTLFVGEDDTLTSITASYNYGPDKPLTLADCSYSSDNETVATVATGVVTGVGAGSATITVSYTEGTITKTDTVEVMVNPIGLDSITVLPETMSLFVGEDHTIASITARYNYGPDKPLTLADCSYSSNNEVIATVDTGVVTGVSDGSATITISYEENGITKTDTVAVDVNPIPPNLELLPHTQNAKTGESFSINVEVENVTDLLGASITLNFDHVAMPFLSATPGSFFSNADVLADLSGPLGSITLWLDSVEEPASGTGTIMIVSFVAVMKGNNYPITFGVTELKDKDNQSIVHTTGSDCKVHIKKP